jgi:hypothetical protein
VGTRLRWRLPNGKEKRNIKLRKQIANKIGSEFELPGSIFTPIAPNVPKMALKTVEEVVVQAIPF